MFFFFYLYFHRADSGMLLFTESLRFVRGWVEREGPRNPPSGAYEHCRSSPSRPDPTDRCREPVGPPSRQRRCSLDRWVLHLSVLSGPDIGMPPISCLSEGLGSQSEVHTDLRRLSDVGCHHAVCRPKHAGVPACFNLTSSLLYALLLPVNF